MNLNKTQVFISFKNTDSNGNKTLEALKAEEIYSYLTNKMGYTVFMMNESLSSMGVSNYKRIIDESLEDSKVLITISSSSGNIESEWVRYECDTFLGELLAGRKHGHIFNVLLDKMRIDCLPISLRKYQCFKANNLNPLYSFIESAFHEVKEPGRIEFIYPCIFSKTEDNRIKAVFPDLGIETYGEDYDVTFMNAQNLLLRYFMYAVKYEVDVEAPSKIEVYRNKISKDDYLMLVGAVINVKGEPATILK